MSDPIPAGADPVWQPNNGNCGWFISWDISKHGDYWVIAIHDQLGNMTVIDEGCSEPRPHDATLH